MGYHLGCQVVNEWRRKGQNESHGSMILLGRGHMCVGERESLSHSF